MNRKRRPRQEFDCPHCGATFPASRPACPECGSDADTGWSEDALTGYSATDIPDTFDEEAYLDVVAGLPGGPRRTSRRSFRQRFWAAVGVLVVIAFVTVFVGHC
jgi:hypothetical protein